MKKKTQTDLTTDDIVGKLTNSFKGIFNLRSEESTRCKLGTSQPIMTHHSPFIRISNGAFLELHHVLESLLQSRFHFLKKFVSKSNPAHVQVESQFLVLVQPIHVSLPQGLGIFRQEVAILGQFMHDVVS